MTNKRTITFGGKETEIFGLELKMGDTAPEFSAQMNDWSYLEILSHTKGKVRIIAAMPSLETAICDREVRTFNEKAAQISEDIVIVAISADLPFTQKNWCGAADIKNVLVVSDHIDMDFGKKYSCLIQAPRVLQRASFIIGKDDKIHFVEYLPALANEPSYDKIIKTATNLL